jgi:two-component system osmolarity sensor histidine kinase EnvZ
MKLFPKSMFGRLLLLILFVTMLQSILLRLSVVFLLGQPAGHQLAVASQFLMIAVEEVMAGNDTRANHLLVERLRRHTGMVIVENSGEHWDEPPDLPFFRSWRDILNQAGDNALLLRYQRQPRSMLWLLHVKPPVFSVGMPVAELDGMYTFIRLIFLAGGILAVFASYLIARYLSAPLKNLAEAARSIGRDLNSVDIKPSGPLEIRVVGQALNLMRADLDRMVKAQEFLLAGISHDLRTPLTRIRLSIEMLPAAPDDLSAGMKEDVEEMNAILHRFIELARVNIEETEPWQVGEITPLLLDVAKKYQRADADLTLSLGKLTPPVRYKPMALRRLLYNLIDNGLKHGGGRVKLITQGNGHKLVLRVADQGAGLPMTSAELGAYSGLGVNQGLGNGLGLLIVQRIAQLHGAELTLRNGKQGGAEVIVRLDAYSETG